jgi:hypothetical protein
MLDPSEAAAIARGLVAKYGTDTLAFVEGRAGRARAIGDELALAAWRAVMAEARHLLSAMAQA